jgi:hypothetical protein
MCDGAMMFSFQRTNLRLGASHYCEPESNHNLDSRRSEQIAYDAESMISSSIYFPMSY